MSPRVFGLMLVRNEADILRTNLLHHFGLGIEQFLIIDNGSTDGTDLVLQEMAKTGRVQWLSEPGPYYQSEITTELACEAHLRGADWVIPIDADEFWHVPRGSLLEILGECGAGALQARVVNFVQRREQIDRSPDALLHMTWRPPEQIGPIERIPELLGTKQIGFVEIIYPPKCIARASLALEIGVGNHSVRHASGPVEDTDLIVCLHAPLRSRSVLEVQADHGRRARQAGEKRMWHWHRWLRLAEQEGLEREWLANSYQDGSLDVYGVRRPLLFDPTLRDLVSPWIPGAASAEMDRPAQDLALGLPLTRPELPPWALRSILERMALIEGRMSVSKAYVLIAAVAFSLIQKEPHPVVEIGSHCGWSTSVLGDTVQQVCPGMKVYAIDPHEPDGEDRREAPTWERFARTIEEAGLTRVVVPIRKRSLRVVWDRPIGLLFINGLPDSAGVSRDFHHFERWIVPGGYVAFDDYESALPGVIEVADGILARGNYRRFLQVGKMLVLEKLPVSESTNESGRREEPLSEPWERLRRQEKGITLLKQVLREQTRDTEDAVGERDRIIVGLQAELHEKVGLRDGMIRELQAELHAKVGERDQMIRDLQRELHEKVAECNRVIGELQARLANVPS